MAEDRRALGILLREQERVITRAQATDCGLSPAQIQHRIRPGGPWQRLLPGVYLAVTGTPTPRQAEIAAMRRAGPKSALTGLLRYAIMGSGFPAAGS
jgi:hypothetical protein